MTADDGERALKAKRVTSPYPSEWVKEHEEEEIKKFRAEAKELVFSINGIRATLRKTRIDVTAEGGR